MSQEMFSIITPSFHQLDWLRLALASVADQGGVDVEHIVQDAGSQGVEDMFRDTVSSSAHPHQQTRLFVEKDNGMYDAVNRALRRAAGNILAYLNCDEQYLPGTLRVVTDFFAQHPDVDVAFGNVVIVDRMGQYICSREVLQPRLYHTWVCTNPVFTAATFFRRRLIDEHGLFFNDRWRDVGDAAWLLELLKRGIRMAPLGQFTTAFADTGENMNLKPNAVLEQRQLGQSAPLWARSLKPVWILQHRLRRMAAGYYFPRPFDYSIYTLEHDKERQTFHVARPTGIWRDRL
jgi:glycosyltransferase involved in cell wall biosynthesis